MITIDGTALAATTDTAGDFVLTGVAPGTWRLRLLHPVLDTIGLRVVSRDITVGESDTVHFVLAVPGAETIIRAKCGIAPDPDLPSALFGIVLDGAGSPVPEAIVRLAWVDVRIGRSGVHRTPQQLTFETSIDGRFRLCGLPPEITGELYAVRGEDSTGSIPVRFGESLVLARALILAPRERGTLRGVVRSIDTAAVQGARVSLVGGVGAAVTDAQGRFVLEGQPTGSRTMIVRRIGYQPAELAVQVERELQAEVAVTLAPFVAVLDPVLVQRRLDVALERVGYTARLRAGMGRFLDADQIERTGATDMIDLLRRFQQLRVVITVEGERVLVGRPLGFDSEGCVQYFIDGQPWLGDVSPLRYIQPLEVGAVEVYSAATTPAEFTRALEICETVVIWTRFGLRVR